MSTDPTRASLLSRVRDPANAGAWREFEACYGDLLLRYARSRGLSQADAEDVRQLVLMSLSRTLRAFKYSPERGRFRDYLGRVARRTLARWVARPKSRPALQSLLDDDGVAGAAAPHDAADALWEREWMDHHIRRAMETITMCFDPRSVHVFERLLAGDSVEAVAAGNGMTTAAVHKVKQRVRARLEELIAEQVREEDEPDG